MGAIDIDAFAAMLAEDASFAMPPLASWFDGRAAILRWVVKEPLSGVYRWRALAASANGQPALGYYSHDPDRGRWIPFALNVLTFDGPLIGAVTAFIARSPRALDPASVQRLPDQPHEPQLTDELFVRFGLPAELAD